jgi:hypothetical protein
MRRWYQHERSRRSAIGQQPQANDQVTCISSDATRLVDVLNTRVKFEPRGCVQAVEDLAYVVIGAQVP